MAERRMFSNSILRSAKFLKMPSETQNLYFHLCMNADDDGVVEAFTIMRLIGSTEDSLKLLSAKDFVTILNDDYVSFISDWREHNKIRADRKIDSMYKDLLLQIVPTVELLDGKDRADRQHKKQMDESGTSHGRHSIVEVSIVEDSIDKPFSFTLTKKTSIENTSKDYKCKLNEYITNTRKPMSYQVFYDYCVQKDYKYKNFKLAYDNWNKDAKPAQAKQIGGVL